MVPQVAGTALGTGRLELQVDGRTQVLPAPQGNLDWLVPVPRATAATRVAMRLTATTRLPDGDERPTGAKLELLEILPRLPVREFNFGQYGATRLATMGVDQDGWMERRAEVALPSGDRPLRATLTVEFPGWAGHAEGKLSVSGDGSVSALHLLKPGETVITVTLPPNAAPRQLRFELANLFALPAPDTRERGARLLRMSVDELP
jgi:hypothetical protein